VRGEIARSGAERNRATPPQGIFFALL
jgi:hypothetical protein